MLRVAFCPYCGYRLSETGGEESRHLQCAQCRMPISENPVPATCAVVADSRHQILLVKTETRSESGQWCLPGGFMQQGESPEQAALRRLEDQTGIHGQIELLLGVTTQPGQTVDTVLMIGYLVVQPAGRPITGDGIHLAWFHPDRLPPLAFRSHRRFIRLYYAASPDNDPVTDD